MSKKSIISMNFPTAVIAPPEPDIKLLYSTVVRITGIPEILDIEELAIDLAAQLQEAAPQAIFDISHILSLANPGNGLLLESDMPVKLSTYGSLIPDVLKTQLADHGQTLAQYKVQIKPERVLFLAHGKEAGICPQPPGMQ